MIIQTSGVMSLSGVERIPYQLAGVEGMAYQLRGVEKFPFQLRGLGDDMVSGDGDPTETTSVTSSDPGGGGHGNGESVDPAVMVGGSGGSTTCFAYGSDGSCLSITSDGGTTTQGCGMSTVGACAPKAGSSASSSGGSSNSNNSSNSASNFLNSILSAFSAKPGVTTQAQCSALKGTWTGTACIGLASATAPSSTTLLIGVGVIAAIILLSKK